MSYVHRAKVFAALSTLLTLSACGGAADPVPDDSTTEQAAPAPVTSTPSPAYASLTGNAAKGETLFAQCRTCHSVDPGQNRLGPSLHGMIGRPAGQVPGFNYSAANKSSGTVWTEEQLYLFLESPRAAMPGTKMAYAGMKQPQDRADLIAWLKIKS